MIRWTTGSVLLLLPTVTAAESWTAMSTTNAPSGRGSHSAVWTGSKMIVWGGEVFLSGTDTGGVYDPATDSWTPTSTTNAPTGRAFHTAVWTGSRMIVWGGNDGTFADTGGIYDPATDTWTPTSTTNAPSGRYYHTAVWTGSRMIVWGGLVSAGISENTGGIYDPATDTWTAVSTTNAPTSRRSHTAVWTGSKMIVWGGVQEQTGIYLGSGGIYDAATDTWTPTTPTNSPTGRRSHTAVWTGSKMTVWSGYNNGFVFNTGATYDPVNDAWSPTTTINAPSARFQGTAVRMGPKMIGWGGTGGAAFYGTGGIYDPATDAWTTTSLTNAPTGRAFHTAVWTGSKMIVWGGDEGGSYASSGALYAPGTEGPLGAGIDRVFPLVPQCGIPDGAQALSVNLAVALPTAGGNLRLYPAGTALPTVSSINYSAGQTRSNNAIVTPNASGELAVRCAQASGTAHFILDVNGYFDSSGSFFTLLPCRLVDTRQ